MTETTAQKTIAAQSELIQKLERELATLKRANKEQVQSLKLENEHLRDELYTAEALLLGNKITRNGVEKQQIQQVRETKCQKTHFVPRRVV